MVTAAKLDISRASERQVGHGHRLLSQVPESRTQHHPEAYIGLVTRLAHQLARRLPDPLEAGDLLSAGTLGLLDAIEKFGLEALSE